MKRYVTLEDLEARLDRIESKLDSLIGKPEDEIQIEPIQKRKEVKP